MQDLDAKDVQKARRLSSLCVRGWTQKKAPAFLGASEIRGLF